jgi:large subunit ribosomal protein L16
MRQPKRTKYRKQMKGRNRGVATRGNKISFGDIGIKSCALSRLTSRQLESARKVITRQLKRAGKVYIRAFPDKPITKKPLEVRQGKGKGPVDHYVALIQPGRVIFEIEGVDEEIAYIALGKAIKKLPFRCIIVKKRA